MTLKEYKNKVHINTAKAVGEKEATRLIKLYEDDLPMLLEKNQSVEVITTAMIMDY